MQSPDEFLESLFADVEARKLAKKKKSAKQKKERQEYLQLIRPKTVPVSLTRKEEWINVAYVRTVTHCTCTSCQTTQHYTHPQLLLLSEHKGGTAQVFKPIAQITVDLPRKLFDVYESIEQCANCFMTERVDPEEGINENRKND